MQGQLRPGLQQLRQLTVLHLTNNELSGALPPEWGEPGAFPALLELDMSFNLLNGSIPDAWGAAGPAFASLLSLQVSGQAGCCCRHAAGLTELVVLLAVLFSGQPSSLPRATTPSAYLPCALICSSPRTALLVRFQQPLRGLTRHLVSCSHCEPDITLLHCWCCWQWSTETTAALRPPAITMPPPIDPPNRNLGDNQFTGSLPPAIGGLRSLRLLSLQGNAFSGSLPPTWEVPAGGGAANDTRRLEQLFLHNNSLTGSLPEAWALLGAFSALRSLWLSNNPLGGSLLAAWGASGAFPALQDLNLSSAGLSGPLPAWGAGLQSLREL